MTLPAAQSAARGVLLQLCPHDEPPFDQLCRRYADAAISLGMTCHTVFLGDSPPTPTSAATGHRIDYLRQPELDRLHALVAALAALELPEVPELIIAHRYRAYRLMLRAGLAAPRRLVLAHEFGLFARRRRRWLHLLRGRDVRVAGVSPAVCNELTAAVGRSVLLPNVIDGAAARERLLSRDAARQALGLPATAWVIGVVGRLHPKKRPELALAGFRVLHAQHPDARLAFVGDGERREALEREAGDLPVSFCGFVADAARCYRAFDVLLLPSGQAEAFGMVALEAMVAGVPVVTGAAPGPAYVLDDLGCYFAGAEPAAVAASLAEVRRAWSRPEVDYPARAFARVQQEFSIAALARRLDSLLTEAWR